MKVLLDSYDTFAQNPAGGVNTRVFSYLNAINEIGENVDIQLFDKYKHKIKDFDIVHLMKASPGKYDLAHYAFSNHIPVMISTIIPLVEYTKIKCVQKIEKILPLHSPQFFIKKMLEYSSILITESKKEQSFIQSVYGIKSEKIHPIPNGVSLPQCIEKELFVKKYNLSKPYILSVGRVDPNKNQLNLIRALKKTNIPLVVIGGPDASCVDYFEQCKMEAGNDVIFTGWIKHDDPMITSAYMNAKVIALPSINEIFGNAIVEGGYYANMAVSENLPIVEMIPANYLHTFNPRSVDSIRNALVNAYSAPLNENAQVYCQKKFSWENVAKEHFKLYQTLVK